MVEQTDRNSQIRDEKRVQIEAYHNLRLSNFDALLSILQIYLMSCGSSVIITS